MEKRMTQVFTYGKLMRKMLLYFAGAIFCGDLMLMGSNFFILGVRGANFMFSGLFILVGSAFIVGLLFVYAYMRLRIVGRAAKENATEPERQKAYFLLLNFPHELFWGLLGTAIVFSIAFHISDVLRRGHTLSEAIATYADQIIFSILSEMSTTLMLGVLIFTFLRRLFRNYLLHWEPIATTGAKRASILKPLLLTYISTFVIALLQLLRIDLQAESKGVPPDSRTTVMYGMFYFAFGLVIITMSTVTIREELRELIQGMKQLAGRERKLRGKMPVLSRDEPGELAVAFNDLQDQVARENEEIDQELRLALKVQQKLFPMPEHEFGPFKVAAVCLPHREVGGDLFDVVPLDDSRFAFLVGDVSGKGLPAALIMSAVIVLFRAEIRQGGGAGEVVTRLNRQLCGTILDNAMVTVGIGIVDLTTCEISYSSGGHLAPYSIVRGELTEFPSSSLPLGLEEDAEYDEIRLRIAPGEAFIAYTDGLLEVEAAGDGFPVFESCLRAWDANQQPLGQLDAILARCGNVSGPRADDRTLLVVQRSPVEASHREWMICGKPGIEKTAVREAGCWAEPVLGSQERAADLQSALAEGIINAMEHGNRSDPEARVFVEGKLDSERVVLRIYDNGEGFDPVHAASRELLADDGTDALPRGYGLRLIGELCSGWSVGRSALGFYVELSFEAKERAHEQHVENNGGMGV